jgi:pimeloyl-ACP methyl ester carboxylesterase
MHHRVEPGGRQGADREGGHKGATPPRWRSRGCAAAMCAWLLLGCSSQSAAPSASHPVLAGHPMAACVISGEVPVKASVDGFCGTLTVPEDRSNPSGRQIGLHVAVVPAAAHAKPDPFFALAGGPGEASTSFFAWLPGLYADVHATHDIVLVDQRGTGASHPLALPALPDTTGLSAPEADAKLTAWAKDGLAALDADPRFYTSSVAADDLDAVRAALGYDTIDLYGTSYGGELAQYYLRQHPDRVHVAVMDGTTPLDVPVLERMGATSGQALDLLLARCGRDPACAAAFPNLATEWSTLVAAFREGVTVTDPTSGTTGVADLATIGPALHNALLTEAAAAQLPLAIHLAAAGQWDQVNELVPPSDASPSGGATLLMRDEILCSEAWARWDPAEVARVGGASYAVPFVQAWARGMATICRYLPTGVVPADDAAPVQTDIPVLWLAGDADPQDPPSNLATVPSQEPNARVVVMPAQEHVVGHLGCGPQVIAQFIDAGTATGLDTSCVAQGAAPAPTFHLP